MYKLTHLTDSQNKLILHLNNTSINDTSILFGLLLFNGSGYLKVRGKMLFSKCYPLNFSTRPTLHCFLPIERAGLRVKEKGRERRMREGKKPVYLTWIVQDSLVQPYSDFSPHSGAL